MLLGAIPSGYRHPEGQNQRQAPAGQTQASKPVGTERALPLSAEADLGTIQGQDRRTQPLLWRVVQSQGAQKVLTSQARRILFKHLNRRSQRKSFTGERFVRFM